MTVQVTRYRTVGGALVVASTDRGGDAWQSWTCQGCGAGRSSGPTSYASALWDANEHAGACRSVAPESYEPSPVAVGLADVARELSCIHTAVLEVADKLQALSAPPARVPAPRRRRRWLRGGAR